MSQLDRILAAVGDLAALGRADALDLADEIRDAVIAQHERDPAMPRRCYREWHDVLANVHANIAMRISQRILNHVHRDEVVHAVEDAVPWGGDDD
jgi:hypothetical protein